MTFFLMALAGAAAPDLSRLTDTHRHDLRCAAAFAIVADMQARGGAGELPPLANRGRRFMGLVGARVLAEAGLDAGVVQALLTQAARDVGRARAPAEAAGCMAALDIAVPRKPAPARGDCAALLSVYGAILASRDPADPNAAALTREAQSLGPIDPAAQDAVRRAIGNNTPPDADDVQACRRMAQSR